jgi:hypothetical protein
MSFLVLNKTLAQYQNDFSVITYSYGEIVTYTFRTLGTVTASLNILIFIHKTILNSSETFYYLLTVSVSDFLYLGLLLFANIVNKRKLNSMWSVSQYLANFLFIGVNNYFSSSLAIFNIVIENFLTVQRL